MNVLEQTGPLKVVRAFRNDEGDALVHLHNVSGGILGGDQFQYNVDLQPGAQVQLTTTSATRVYRQRDTATTSLAHTNITIGEQAILEYLPDPIIPFARSAYHQETTIQLAENAGLFWWETITPGREARGELFEYARLNLSVCISVADRPIALEKVRLEPSLRPLNSAVRLGQYRYFSTFYICKTGLEAAHWLMLENELSTLAAELSRPGSIFWSVSTLVAHGLIVRCLSRTGRPIPAGLIAFWQAAKQSLYGRAALPPRKVY